MAQEQLKQAVWNTLQALNRAWTVEKRPEKLTDFFHNAMVAVSGGARKRIEGKEACIAAWKSFVDNTTIHSWKEVDPTIQI